MPTSYAADWMGKPRLQNTSYFPQFPFQEIKGNIFFILNVKTKDVTVRVTFKCYTHDINKRKRGGDSGVRPYGNEYRTTMVCIDGYDGGVPSGRLYNPALPGGARFESLMEFILCTEALLDGMQFPQSFTAVRAFAPPVQAPPSQAEEEAQHGKRATFALRILFRQNASWQGSVQWLEENREQSFRSALELFLLLDSALRTTP